MDYAAFAAPTLVERFGKNAGDMPWILWDEASGAIGAETWYARCSGGRPPVVRITDAIALLALASSGVGGAVLPVPMAAQSGLIQLTDPIPTFATDLWCLCHDDLRHSDRVRRFMDQVVEVGVGA